MAGLPALVFPSFQSLTDADHHQVPTTAAAAVLPASALPAHASAPYVKSHHLDPFITVRKMT
jgi:hypothetical protein